MLLRPTFRNSINKKVMKKIGILLLFAALLLQGLGQEVTAVNSDTTIQGTVADTNDITRVIIGNDAISIDNNKDAVNLKVGNRGLTILESLEGTGPKVKFRNFKEEDSDFQDNKNNSKEDKERRRNRFRGHWSGVELGFNSYLTSDRSFTLPDEIDYMSLHSGKSINFNLNFSQLSIGLTRHIGFVTGLGLDWNNYRFNGNNNIQKGSTGIIEPLIPTGLLDKSKFTTLYLTLPFMLELQLPTDHNRINLAAGPIGAIKLSSHSKMVFDDGDKVKSNSDFSLNLLRYGLTARAGYGNFQIYGTYFMSPLFQSGKSPEGIALYPFEVGIAFTFND
jgi:hypothetical protein